MLSEEKIRELLVRSIEVSKEAMDKGNAPFGAVLADKDGNILMEAGNNQTSENNALGHAELLLIEKVTKVYSPEFLKKCTIVASGEPCTMCSGAIFWSNIGNVAFAMSEKTFREIVGYDESPNFDLPCAEVISRGNKDIVVTGPYSGLEDEAAEVHRQFWQ